MVIIAGFGNPLLDITVETNDTDLLRKYNLNDDDQIEFDEFKMKLLMDDIKKYPVEYTAGGCVQNTLRVFQWLCDTPGNTYMIGCIGNDENAKTLKELVESAGVITFYNISNKLPTGISVAIVNQENRSLIASIGAAESINIDSFKEITNNGQLFKTVDLFYMEGFFIPKREAVAKYIFHISKTKRKLFAFNISAPYISKNHQEIVKYFAENCDILFGNVQEYASLSNAFDFNGNTLDFAIYLNKIKLETDWKYKKMIVVTNGSRNVVCVHSEGYISEIEVPKIPQHELKDTTGAGDSFVAGFFTALFKNCMPDMCLKYGCWTAQEIIKQIGCKIPNYSPTIPNL